jgi:hypothetical protein
MRGLARSVTYSGDRLSVCRSIFGIDPEPLFALNNCRRKSQGEEDEAATHPQPAAFSCMSPSPTFMRQFTGKARQLPLPIASDPGLCHMLRMKFPRALTTQTISLDK